MGANGLAWAAVSTQLQDPVCLWGFGCCPDVLFSPKYIANIVKVPPSIGLSAALQPFVLDFLHFVCTGFPRNLRSLACQAHARIV